MGKRYSKPVIPLYPPVDPLFTEVGCSGFTYREFSDKQNDRLNKAPFLSYKITGSNYSDFVSRLMSLLQTLPPTASPPKKAPTVSTAGRPPRKVYVTTGNEDASRRLYGPVFLFCALNVDTSEISAYVYLPSMQKSGKPWASYDMLVYNHRWMHLLMHSKVYRVTPFTNCMLRKGTPDYSPFGYDNKYNQPNLASAEARANLALQAYIKNENYADIGSLILGCTSSTSGCIQSESVHRAMGIYDPKKNNDYDRENPLRYGYPIAYFRTYVINQSDSRVSDLFNANSFQDLQLSGLVEGFEMLPGCMNMLVAKNYSHVFMLLPNALVIYRLFDASPAVMSVCSTTGAIPRGIPVKTQTFKGGQNTRMVIEQGYLVVFSAKKSNGEEQVALRIQVTTDTQSPITLVLNNEGILVAYNKNGDDVSAPGLRDLAPDTGDDLQTAFQKYNAYEDYQRRLRNLLAYLRLNNLYMQEIGDDGRPMARRYGFTPTGDPYVEREEPSIYNFLPKYDARVDYVQRYNNLIDFYRAIRLYDPNDPNAKYLPLPGASPVNLEHIMDGIESTAAAGNLDPDAVSAKVDKDLKDEEERRQQRDEEQSKLLNSELGRLVESESKAPKAEISKTVTDDNDGFDYNYDDTDYKYISSSRYNKERDRILRVKQLYHNYRNTLPRVYYPVRPVTSDNGFSQGSIMMEENTQTSDPQVDRYSALRDYYRIHGYPTPT